MCLMFNRRIFRVTAIIVAAGALILAYRDRHIRLRSEVVWAKLNGRLPVSWGEFASMLTHSSESWPPERLLVVKARDDRPCGALIATPLGDYWTPAKDVAGLRVVLWEQMLDIYEQGEARVRRGDVVLDLGAHLGMFTRRALNNGAKTVVGYEPDPVNYSCLERTFEREIANGRVRLVRAAVWDRSGSLRFAAGGITAHVADGAGSSFIEVPSVTIDDSVQQLGLERVDFIKSDIEGAERNALRGAQRTLARFRPRMGLCIYHKPDDHQVLTGLARAAFPGYRTSLRFTPTQEYFY
jgi:FkbM family methyltransferase